MEAIACREGPTLANNLALRRIKVALDSSNGVRNILGMGMGPYGQIVQEIRLVHERLNSMSLLMKVEHLMLIHII
jgi:hypothetical protein